jgi:hypothetical protein
MIDLKTILRRQNRMILIIAYDYPEMVDLYTKLYEELMTTPCMPDGYTIKMHDYELIVGDKTIKLGHYSGILNSIKEFKADKIMLTPRLIYELEKPLEILSLVRKSDARARKKGILR